MSYIFSFSVRNDAMRFFDEIREFDAGARLVNSPSVDGVGCGLSVKCNDYDKCRAALSTQRYSHFIGAYSYDGTEYIRIR